MILTPHIQTAIRIHADEMVKIATTRQAMIDEGIAFVQDEALAREKEQIKYLLSTAEALLDYANSLSVEVQIEPSRKVHNPDGLTNEQVGIVEGWRLLDEDEIIPNNNALEEIESWDITGWDNEGFFGANQSMTYRTKLTREELKQKRGLA